MKLLAVDEGLRRIYYKNTDKLMCFQEDFEEQFNAYHCSSDGEPSNEFIVPILLMQTLCKPPEETVLAQRFNAWHSYVLKLGEPFRAYSLGGRVKVESSEENT